MARKIKVFLSGVVNSTNAQNLNCRALMKYLDPEKFEVRALAVYSGNLDLPDGTPRRVGKSRLANAFYATPKAFYPVRYPAKIWHAIQLVRGILWSDVAYLCKPEHWKLQRFVCRLFGKKAFKTIEGAFIGTNMEKALRLEGTPDGVRQSCAFTGHAYSITHAMQGVNERLLGLKTEDAILYLGVEPGTFFNDGSRTKLTDVCIIGGNLFYKGLDDFFQLASRFPQLTFHVVGSGLGNVNPASEVERHGLKNVIAHGEMTHATLAPFLKDIQLHVFPSRAEGFPKVTLETAAAGVPSVVYDDYGADEWIAHGKNGFVVKTLDEMAACIQGLLDEPAKLQPMAEAARALAKSFDWKVRVKDWERVIEELAK